MSSNNSEELSEAEEQNDNPTAKEKVALATKHKELGTSLLKQGKLKEAIAELDKAFVHIFTPRDQWEWVYSESDRQLINQFKIPCHLNRGLCKWKLGKLESALWDFDEVVRIDPNNIKALYRRGCVYSEWIEKELSKEEKKEFWNTDKVERMMKQAKKDLRKAYEMNPTDNAIIRALHVLKSLEQRLQLYLREQRKQQKQVFSFAFSKLQEQNRKDEDERMPPLERIRIDDL
eukprot:jgi/Galph1/5169/GphlegSOOS_G3856.1